MQGSEEDLSFMSSDYRDILRHGDQIKEDLANSPGMLQYLWGVTTDLFVDALKSKGSHNIKGKIG